MREALKGKAKAIHCEKVKFNSKEKYLLLLRNPVERFASAFYWRKFLLTAGLEKNEKELLLYHKYPTLGSMCKSLYPEGGALNLKLDGEINQIYHRSGHPSHTSMGIDYYIGDFVNECNKKNIIGVICTETLSEDLRRLFDVEATPGAWVKNNEQNKKPLNKNHRTILKQYLRKHYAVIEKLNKLQLLSRKQFDILIK